jgi:hypothetical protein
MRESERDGVLCLASKIGPVFGLEGPPVEISRYGNGHVNDTFLAVYASGGGREAFVHQRLATVFADPHGLMENVVRVTEHLRSHMEALGIDDLDRRCLSVVPTVRGSWCHVDEEGRHWRTYRFVERSVTYEEAPGPEAICEAGRAFGEMLLMLADLPAPSLNATIERFHDLPRRLDQLRQGVEADHASRLAGAEREVGEAMALQPVVRRWERLVASGDMPLRPVHNDTKLNNVLFDATEEADSWPAGSVGRPRAICVVDLDTVMPGWSICDFGDLVRTSVSDTREDEADTAAVKVDPERFEAALSGWLGASSPVLHDIEVENLVFGAEAMATEVAIRFLADHLAGDTYFRVDYPGHNLVRARAQLALAARLIEAEGQLEELVAKRWATRRPGARGALMVGRKP